MGKVYKNTDPSSLIRSHALWHCLHLSNLKDDSKFFRGLIFFIFIVISSLKQSLRISQGLMNLPERSLFSALVLSHFLHSLH